MGSLFPARPCPQQTSRRIEVAGRVPLVSECGLLQTERALRSKEAITARSTITAITARVRDSIR